jgi:hypothetical protein
LKLPAASYGYQGEESPRVFLPTARRSRSLKIIRMWIGKRIEQKAKAVFEKAKRSHH